MTDLIACVVCGAEMPANLKHCGACSSPLPATDTADDLEVHHDVDVLQAAVGDAVEVPVAVALPVPRTSPGWRVKHPRRWLLAGGVTAGLLVCAFAAGFVVETSAATPTATAAASPTAQQVVGIPGWSVTASWMDAAPSTGVVVSADGKRFASISSGTVTVRDQDGARTAQAVVSEDARLLSGLVDGKPALLAAGGEQLLVWSGDMTTNTVWELPAGARVSVLGAGVVVTGADGQVYVVTGGGLAPFVSPRAGAAALAVTSNGAVQWASARGEVLVASAAGSVVHQFPVVAPVPGATVSRWLAGGTTIALVWALPDGSTMLATHSADDGTVLASTPVDAAAATDRLVLSASSTMAMLHQFHIDLSTGWIGVPDPEFAASTALRESFYGASGTTAAVLVDGAVITTPHAPTIVPVAVTADGSLIATVQGTVAIFPKTPAN